MSVFDLKVTQEPTVLPVAYESLYAAGTGDLLHLAGIDEHRRARYLAVNGRGEVAGAASELPLIEVTGLSACGGAIIVSGVTAENRGAVLGLQSAGQLEWSAEVAGTTQFQYWPRVVCSGGRAWLFSITGGASPELCLIEIEGSHLRTPVSLALADDTDAIDVYGDDAGILVARVHGGSRFLELMSIDEGRVTALNDVEAIRPSAPSLQRAEGEIVLAWISEPGEPRLQWFDNQLKPTAPPQVLSAPLKLGSIANIRLKASPRGLLAGFFWSEEVVGDGETVHNDDGTVAQREPRRNSPLRVALYDPGSHQFAAEQLVDLDARLYAGDWLGEALAVAHRRLDARLSIFAPEPSPG